MRTRKGLLPAALLTLTLAAIITSSASALELLAVDYDTGDMYGVSTTDASVALLGTTAVPGLGSLELAPNGMLYGFTVGQEPAPVLYEIDPITFAPTAIGPLGIGSLFEGSLVFAPNGTVYGTNRGSTIAPDLFTLDLATGQATVVGTIGLGSDQRRDIGGMAWRADGMLVGLDRVSRSLIEIDTATAAASVIMPLTDDLGDPLNVGGIGGMVVVDGFGYFATAGIDNGVPGSGQLYRFDPYSGAYDPIGDFGAAIPGSGIGGLAVVPEPATLALFACGAVMLLRRKRPQA